MPTFGLRLTGRWAARAIGDNPLLRRTDRIEALVVLAAIAVALAVVPVAGAVGAAVYGSRLQLYSEQAHTRHRVAATVIETAQGKSVPHSTSNPVRAVWVFGNGSHADWLTTDQPAKAGDRLDLWVNDGGGHVAPPTPASQAAVDAVGVGAGIWLVVVCALRALVALGCSPLNRIREAQWEREITSLAGGGRTNQSQ
jgi:hypothetical protein